MATFCPAMKRLLDCARKGDKMLEDRVVLISGSINPKGEGGPTPEMKFPTKIRLSYGQIQAEPQRHDNVEERCVA